MITFKRPANGRNLGGMLSHVFRPMTTALSEPVRAFIGEAAVVVVDGSERDSGGAAAGDTRLVTDLKNAMSDLIGGQGRLPRYPMPMGGLRLVATIT